MTHRRTTSLSNRFKRAISDPAPYFSLNHSKTTGPQINEWDFISFFKSRGRRKKNNPPKRFWHFLAKSCSNCCRQFSGFFFFPVGGSERLSGVVSAHTQLRSACDAVSPLHSTPLAASSTPSGFTRQLLSPRARLRLTCARPFLDRCFKSRAAV